MLSTLLLRLTKKKLTAGAARILSFNRGAIMTITPKVIYRDVWGLGPPNNNYPGAFPRGLLAKVRRRWWGEKRLWLFSGSHKDRDGGICVDIKPEVVPNIVADCEHLPFKDESFTFVLADPPYSEEEARRLYGLKYCNMLKVMNEAARVCKSEGYVLLLHRLIPFHHPMSNSHFKRLIVKAIVGVYTIAGYTNIRALTVWTKQRTLM